VAVFCNNKGVLVMLRKIKGAVFGFAAGDALGVPAEFESRQERAKAPICDMVGFGTYNQPEGTWSDDTSMTLATMDSLKYGLDYENIMKNFKKWMYEGYFTPYGTAFDIGMATKEAIGRYKNGTPALICGGNGEMDNGNGSLMRILPAALYDFYKGENIKNIKNFSSLTHRHIRSIMACMLYTDFIIHILKGKSIENAFENAVKFLFAYYKNEESKELDNYNRLIKNLKDLSENEIKSTGYVVDTIEAVFWCLLNTSDYSSCVLKAVNLGGDTDTIAAIAGGAAGLYYGIENIPEKWIKKLAKKDLIDKICYGFAESF
jgi:ADP-ribosylglycohydrolase